MLSPHPHPFSPHGQSARDQPSYRDETPLMSPHLSQSMDETIMHDPNELYHSLRILIPGAAVELEASGFLTLKIPDKKAHQTTVGKLKRQCLQSIQRKILRCEIAGPTAPYTPTELTSHFDPRKYALTRLSKSADQNEIMDETVMMTDLHDWQSMALMLLRVETEEEYMEAQRLQQQRSGPPPSFVTPMKAVAAESSPRRNQNAYAASTSPTAASTSTIPASRVPAASSSSDSTSVPAVSSSSAPVQPFVLQSPTAASSPTGSGFHSFSSNLPSPTNASSSSSPTGPMEYGSPILSGTALDICLCCSTGSYVRAGLESLHLDVGPVSITSNWSCFDGVRNKTQPNNESSSSFQPPEKPNKKNTFKFLQNIHTREWLSWRIVRGDGSSRAAPTVEVFLSPTCLDSSRWTIIKGKIQYLEAAMGNKGYRAFLSLSGPKLNDASLAAVLPVTPGVKSTPPSSSALQICFSVTQGILARRREEWRMFSDVSSSSMLAHFPSNTSLIPTLPASFLPRYFVLTGATLAYWRFPREILGEDVLISEAYERTSQDTLVRIEALTAGQVPLVTIPLHQVRRVLVLSRKSILHASASSPTSAGGPSRSSKLRDRLHIEYLIPGASAQHADKLGVLELEVPTLPSEPFAPSGFKAMWLESFTRKGVSVQWENADEEKEFMKAKITFLEQRGVDVSQLRHQPSIPLVQPSSTGSVEQFDHDEEVHVSALERRKIEEQFLAMHSQAGKPQPPPRPNITRINSPQHFSPKNSDRPKLQGDTNSPARGSLAGRLSHHSSSSSGSPPLLPQSHQSPNISNEPTPHVPARYVDAMRMQSVDHLSMLGRPALPGSPSSTSSKLPFPSHQSPSASMRMTEAWRALGQAAGAGGVGSGSDYSNSSGEPTPFVSVRDLDEARRNVNFPPLDAPAGADANFDSNEAWLTHEKLLAQIDEYVAQHGGSNELDTFRQEQLRKTKERELQSQGKHGVSDEEEKTNDVPSPIKHNAPGRSSSSGARSAGPGNRKDSSYSDDDEDPEDFIFQHITLHGSLANTLHALTIQSATAHGPTARSLNPTPLPHNNYSYRYTDRESPFPRDDTGKFLTPAGKTSRSVIDDPHHRVNTSPGVSNPVFQSPSNPQELYVRNALKDEWRHVREAAKAMKESQAATKDFISLAGAELAHQVHGPDRPAWEDRQRVLEICLATMEAEPRYVNATASTRLSIGSLSPTSNWVLCDSPLSTSLKSLRHSSLRSPTDEMLYLTCSDDGRVTLQPLRPIGQQSADQREPQLWTVLTQEAHQQFQSAAFPTWFLAISPSGPELITSRDPQGEECMWRICFAVVQGYLRKFSAKLAGSSTPKTPTTPVPSQTNSWPKRFFVLSGLTLTYFKTSSDSQHGDRKPVGVYPLQEIESVYAEDAPRFALQLYSGKVVQLNCDSIDNCKHWVDALIRKGITQTKESPLGSTHRTGHPTRTAGSRSSASPKNLSPFSPRPDDSPAPTGRMGESGAHAGALADMVTQSIDPSASIDFTTPRENKVVSSDGLAPSAGSTLDRDSVLPILIGPGSSSNVPTADAGSFILAPAVTVVGVNNVADAALAIKLGAAIVAFTPPPGQTKVDAAHINSVIASLPAHVQSSFHSRATTAAVALDQVARIQVNSLCLEEPLASDREYELLSTGSKDRSKKLHIIQVVKVVDESSIAEAVRVSRLVEFISLDCAATSDWILVRRIRDALMQAHVESVSRLALCNVVRSRLRRALEIVQPSGLQMPFLDEGPLTEAMTAAGQHGPVSPWATQTRFYNTLKPLVARSRTVMHICLQSDLPSPADPSDPEAPLNAYLQSNDLVNHPSNLVGVTMAVELSEFATWTCSDSNVSPSIASGSSTPASLDPVATKLFQDYRGAYLSCAHDGSIYLATTASHESHWKLHKRKTCQLIESFAFPGWFLASDPVALQIFIFDATAALSSSASALSPSTPGASPTTRSIFPRLEDTNPAVRWTVCYAIIQGELLKRGNVPTPREMSPPVTTGGVEPTSPVKPEPSSTESYLSRFFWISPIGLSYWHTAADVHPLPPIRTYPYASMLNVLTDSNHPTRFDIIILENGERIEFRADSPWQKEIWVAALANKGVKIFPHANSLQP